MSYKEHLGKREYVYDYLLTTNSTGDLRIIYIPTQVPRVVELSQFVGKEYDYNTILDSILHDYPTTASFYINDAAKDAIEKQAKKNQQN